VICRPALRSSTARKIQTNSIGHSPAKIGKQQIPRPVVLRREDRAKATATAKAKDSSEMMWSAKKGLATRQIDSG
jgi:hypothetical protein